MSALEISAIIASNNTKYDIKDSAARGQISGKVKIAVGDAMDFRPSDLSVCKISDRKYAELVKNNQTNDACLYVVSSETQNAYGSRVINVGGPAADTDAATKGYVDAAAADVTAQLANYYTKSETSSKTQIQNAFTNYYTKSETSSKTQIQNAFTNYYTKSETSSKTQIQNAFTNYYTKSETNALSTSFRSGLALSSDVQAKFNSLGLNYVKADKKIYLKVDGKNKTTDFVDVADFVKDGML